MPTIKETERERLRIWKYHCRRREDQYPVEFKKDNTVDGKYFSVESFCKFCTRTVYKDTEHVNPKRNNILVFHDREIEKGKQGGGVTQHHTHCRGFWGTIEEKERCRKLRVEKGSDRTREGLVVVYVENPFNDPKKNAINEYIEDKKPEQEKLDALFTPSKVDILATNNNKKPNEEQQQTWIDNQMKNIKEKDDEEKIYKIRGELVKDLNQEYKELDSIQLQSVMHQIKMILQPYFK